MMAAATGLGALLQRRRLLQCPGHVSHDDTDRTVTRLQSRLFRYEADEDVRGDHVYFVLGYVANDEVARHFRASDPGAEYRPGRRAWRLSTERGARRMTDAERLALCRRVMYEVAWALVGEFGEKPWEPPPTLPRSCIDEKTLGHALFKHALFWSGAAHDARRFVFERASALVAAAEDQQKNTGRQRCLTSAAWDMCAVRLHFIRCIIEHLPLEQLVSSSNAASAAAVRSAVEPFFASLDERALSECLSRVSTLTSRATVLTTVLVCTPDMSLAGCNEYLDEWWATCGGSPLVCDHTGEHVYRVDRTDAESIEWASCIDHIDRAVTAASGITSTRGCAAVVGAFAQRARALLFEGYDAYPSYLDAPDEHLPLQPVTAPMRHSVLFSCYSPLPVVVGVPTLPDNVSSHNNNSVPGGCDGGDRGYSKDDEDDYDDDDDDDDDADGVRRRKRQRRLERHRLRDDERRQGAKSKQHDEWTRQHGDRRCLLSRAAS